MKMTHGGESEQKQIFLAAIHSIQPTKSSGELVFGQYMIIPIYHVENWRLIFQRKETLIDKNIDK